MLALAASASANWVVSSKRNLTSYVRVTTEYEIDQPAQCVLDQYGYYPSECYDWESQVADIDYRVLRRNSLGRWVRVYAGSTFAFGGRNVDRIYSFEVRGGWRCSRYRLRTVLVDPYERGTVQHVLPFRRC